MMAKMANSSPGFRSSLQMGSTLHPCALWFTLPHHWLMGVASGASSRLVPAWFHPILSRTVLDTVTVAMPAEVPSTISFSGLPQ
jgi:hypothetical protein